MPPAISDLLSAPTVSGWDIALAVLSIVAAWVISIFAKRATLSVLRKLQGISEGAAILTARIVRYVILLAGVGVAFAFLGASVQPLIAIGLIIAAVVVLALRGISANFAAGVVLQTRHPIKVGDEIEIDDYVGTVRELNGRSVVIITRDGRTVHVPNATLLENLLVNHSELGERRSDVLVRSRAGASQLDDITELITTSTAAVAGVRNTPPVSVLVQTVEPKRLTLLVRFWHDPVVVPAIASPVVRAISEALAGAGLDYAVTSDIPAPPLVPPSEV